MYGARLGTGLRRHTLIQTSTRRTEAGNAVGWRLLRLAPPDDSRQPGCKPALGVDQATGFQLTIPLLRSFLTQTRGRCTAPLLTPRTATGGRAPLSKGLRAWRWSSSRSTHLGCRSDPEQRSPVVAPSVRLGDHPDVRVLFLPGPEDLSCLLVGHRAGDDDVLAVLPVHRR